MFPKLCHPPWRISQRLSPDQWHVRQLKASPVLQQTRIYIGKSHPLVERRRCRLPQKLANLKV